MLPTSGTHGPGTTLTLDIASVTEAAAIAAARWRGRGDEAAADAAAAEAMHDALKALPAKGAIVIGEGEQSHTDLLYVGEEIGAGGDSDPEIDIAADPLEGTTVCAKALPNALSVMAVAKRGNLLKVPEIYMSKMAIGPGYEDGLIDLTLGAAENLQRLAEAKGVPVSGITACILDRPRHSGLIQDVRDAGAAVRLIGDGDIAGVIHTTAARETGIDIYMGVGGAPEGILAAAALRCIGGQMQAQLCPASQEQKERAKAAGIRDLDRIYTLADMAKGDVSFCATGITSGTFLRGVRFSPHSTTTHTVVMRAENRSIRWVTTEHLDGNDAAEQRNPGRIG